VGGWNELREGRVRVQVEPDELQGKEYIAFLNNLSLNSASCGGKMHSITPAAFAEVTNSEPIETFSS
jgi:hypothetical protein